MTLAAEAIEDRFGNDLPFASSFSFRTAGEPAARRPAENHGTAPPLPGAPGPLSGSAQ